MFFARLIAGRQPQVFHLSGVLFVQPKAWAFSSYRRGACAYGHTREEALKAAKRKLEQPRRAAVG